MSKKLYSSIKRSLIGNLSVYLLQIVSMIFYARMFTPAEFGIVASLQVFIIFFQLFSDLGLSPALLSLDRIKKDLRDSAFTFTIILGSILGVLFYGFTFILNMYYGNDSYTFYGIFISISIVFQTMVTVPTIAFHRETRFYSIALVNIVTELLTFAVVIVLFKLDYGVIILFVRILLYSILRFLMLYILSKNTKLGAGMLNFNFAHLSEIIQFTAFQFSFNVVNYFSRNLDNILIGKYLSIESLGLYDKSYQLMRYPLQLITYAINPAIQPILSKEKLDIVLKEHNKLVIKLLVLSIPIALFIGGNNDNVVLLLFGEQWTKVSPIIAILSFIIPIQMVLASSGSFFQSINKPNLLFYSGAIAAVINIIFIIIGVYIGSLTAIATCLCISYSISFIVIYFFLFKYGFKVSCKNFYFTIGKIALSYCPVAIIYYIFHIQKLVTNILIIDLLISGILLLCLLCIFNFKLLKNTLLPKKVTIY